MLESSIQNLCKNVKLLKHILKDAKSACNLPHTYLTYMLSTVFYNYLPQKVY